MITDMISHILKHFLAKSLLLYSLFSFLDVPAVKLPQLGNLPHNTIDVIDNLLFRVTCLVKKSVDLGKPETMNTLIKALNMFGVNTDFAGSLTNILL